LRRNVHVETNNALEGKASAIIGPGAGSLTQRIETGSGNDFTVSAFVQSERPDGCSFCSALLDEKGREVMKVDSLSDMKMSKEIRGNSITT